MPTCISAVQHLRRLRGGSQSHLLRASDGASYVTKFQNNPQHIRVLANEMLATRLGLAIGLPMAPVKVIEVPDWLVERTPAMRIQVGGRDIPCQSGKQLASLYVGAEGPGLTVDYLPRELLERVSNLSDFARALVLDKWTCNADGRQAIFSRKTARSQRYHATFIDQGYCFNAGEWTFPDFPLRGVHGNNSVYEAVTGWEAFEPALSRAEETDCQTIWQCATDIPEEWYEQDREGLERLAEQLSKRRSIIRNLITDFRRSPRQPFPNWKELPLIRDITRTTCDVGLHTDHSARKTVPPISLFRRLTLASPWPNQAGFLSASHRRGQSVEELPRLSRAVFGARSVRRQRRSVRSLASRCTRSSLWH